MRACRPATRSAEGPMSTPRRLAPRSMGTPMILSFLLMCEYLFVYESVPGELTAPGLDGDNGRPGTAVWGCRFAVPVLYPLRIYPINHPGEGNDLPNVFGAADPGHSA